MFFKLSGERIPETPLLADDDPRGMSLGASREGRPLIGYRFGRGPLAVSLIAGCHADEPVGPAMLDHLVAFLAGLGDDDPLLQHISWSVIPHANPDGEARNASWIAIRATTTSGQREGYDLFTYLRSAVREAPVDDVEFGFPRDDDDEEVRPENRAIADFLRAAAPVSLHVTFHGMAFAAGPWFLIEPGWADRTLMMRDTLRAAVRGLGYRLHDIDRAGDKGFFRIDRGFTTRPDSRAMAAHFTALGDVATAALFRPNSMEFVRSLGGDPLTLVSEMPLFLLPALYFAGPNQVRPTAVAKLGQRAAEGHLEELRLLAAEIGVEPMPIVDQMRLQIALLAAGLDAVHSPTS